MGASSWTEIDEVVAVLRRRWGTGLHLKSHLAHEIWRPVLIPVRGPSVTDLLDHLDQARRWLARFEHDATHFRIEHKVVQSRHLGANRIPARVAVDTFDQLCRILGTGPDVQAVEQLIEQTRPVLPALCDWISANPMVALRHAEIWDLVLATVQWISCHDPTCLYLRQIDVEGVDTKFVERHHRLLEQLLAVLLPPNRIDADAAGFAGRLRFLEKPSYTRVRVLDPAAFPSDFTEMTVRTDELARTEPPAANVFVVENEVTYLAFPPVPDAILVFGSGFALTRLAQLAWLHAKEIVYWGDIDTHGFDILSRLRNRFASVRSILMDRETLLAHRPQWVTEPSPTARPLYHLTTEEAALYRDLVEGTYGESVRLEQERIRFSAVRAAVKPWCKRG